MPDVSKRMPASSLASAPTAPLSPLPPALRPAATAGSRRVRSTDGVATLIETACARREADALADAFSPLFPDDSPWATLGDIPTDQARRHGPALSAVAAAVACYREGLTASAGRLERWLDASEEDIRELALRFAKHQLPGVQKVVWAQRLLGCEIPGETVLTKLARLGDARFWRRAIRSILLREREHFYLRLKLVGKSAERYVSDSQLATRLAQLKRQEAWMKETVLVPRYLSPDAQGELLTLAAVAGDARTRFAKTYAFIKAMEAIATERGLVSAMVTLTALPEWHPNPSHGDNSWNGANPREAHRHVAEGWNAIQVELYKKGVGISGLRVVEPHQDGCPHWHIWLIYRPEVETDILAAVMRQFPGKLKLRAPSRRGQKVNPRDVMFETRDDVLAGTGRPLSHPREGAQVEVSRIDPTISSGASYAMKYLLKTVDGGEPLNQQVDLFGDAAGADPSATTEQDEKRKAHQQTAKRVDAWRSLWGINAGMLFGVARCLTAWDELRRLTTKPTDGRLFRLWVLARGSDKEGHIPAGSEQRGDAKGFLEALGGLTAGRDPRDKSLLPPMRLARLTESGRNGYGEEVQRTKGLQLVESKRIAVAMPGKRSGRARTRWETVKTVLASVVTRTQQWMLVPKRLGKQAVALAQDAMAALLNEDSPTELGRQARQRFWAAFHEACAVMPQETSNWRLPIPPPAALTPA